MSNDSSKRAKSVFIIPLFLSIGMVGALRVFNSNSFCVGIYWFSALAVVFEIATVDLFFIIRS